MISITRETTNTFALELSCLIPSNYDFFCFGFVREEIPFTQWQWYITPDNSPAPNRYNLFSLTESYLGATGATGVTGATGANPTSMRLDLGQYQYIVWAATGPWDISNYSPTGPPAPISQSISEGRLVITGDSPFIANDVLYNGQNPNTSVPSVYL